MSTRVNAVTKPKGRAKPKSRAKPKGAKATKASGKTKATRVDAALLDRLVQAAKAVRELAHAPYSRYQVGAAIATRSGAVFVGCNVENASLGATICAERGAIMQMVAHGEREPIACAVVTGDEGASPCGICRQVLAEFARDMPIVMVGLGSRDGETGRVVSLADLLPLAFRLKT
jgi:cytidine deaminase